MNHQTYFRALIIIKKIKTEIDRDTAGAIMDNIRHYLFDDRNKEFRNNMLSPQSCVVREFKSMVNTHIERMCFYDGWGWECGICNGKMSRHMEGKELQKWVNEWRKIKWWYIYDEYETPTGRGTCM